MTSQVDDLYAQSSHEISMVYMENKRKRRKEPQLQ
jgi:hypothetical protein